jgi:hypothetical protein
MEGAAHPNSACNLRPESASNTHMSAESKKQKGRGRLVPTRATGIAYQVQYGIPVLADPVQHGRGGRPMQWTSCSVHSAQAGRLPDGSYFLYTDEGQVHQVKSIDGKWHLLAIAA